MINWSKLKPYQREKSRSFEELCYQIAKKLFENMGRFTSIDDSGGGDGVEFYMTLPTGDQCGWQAKFYYPESRLSVRNRKEAIKNSLTKACQEHLRLKKWILCTPTNFTQNEQSWFENILTKSIPGSMDVELEHWSDRDFNNWLSEPRFSGKRHYFFGELELIFDWFRTQVEKQIAPIRDRFLSILHTETSVDARVHGFLGDAAFAQFITEQVIGFEDELEEYRQAVTELRSQIPYQVGWGDTKLGLLAAVEPLQEVLMRAVEQLRQIRNFVSEQRLDEVSLLDLDTLWAQMEQAYDAYREAESAFDISQLTYNGKEETREMILRKAEQIVGRPSWMAANLMDGFRFLRARLADISQPDLHIFGDAGVGKTHIAAHICCERLKTGLPALLVLGRHFTSDQPLQHQLLRIFDIPPTYSWNDFLQSLDAVSQAYHTRIPLVIDGLNEATRNGAFSDMWRLGLQGLIREIAQTNYVVLITTCRTTYRDAIWPGGAPENVVHAFGFDPYDVETAIEKYFSWYKIKADLTAAPISQFEHPIYLRIFCESQNAAREEEKHIFVGEHTLFEVFEDYLKQCNLAVCNRLSLHHSTSIVIPALNKVAEYLWQHRSPNIPLKELVEVVDGQPLEAVSWEQSKSKAILDEGLLVCRDWYGDEEVVYFTYDLLGGYLIASYLLQEAPDDIKTFIQSKETIAALFSKDHRTLHPLHNDISRCLAGLLPEQTAQYLHELSDNEEAFSLSIYALFELPPKLVSQSCVDLVAGLFNYPQNRKPLLKMAASTVGNVDHSLNASFWSNLLQALPVPERDVSWTEYVRENVERLEKTLIRFEKLCQSDELLSEMTMSRLHLLAQHIMWLLTSTVRSLRDKATRALYWYGRRIPEKFFDLVLHSLEINDPYVPERMLAATYGVAMARQCDFKDSSFTETALPVYGRKLYEAMFKPNAPFATTHILTRYYGRRTIEIALIHHPDLLTAIERKRISPPFTDGGIRKWGQSEDRNKGEYREGNAPIQMDFENYTIGSLVKDRSNYDFEHEEYKIVRANIFWRIYDLGYSLNEFGNIDKLISRANWSFGRAANGGKTDRYGKKYSWIAFFELAGFRQDQGLLDERYNDTRIFDADIDPSFPNPVQSVQVIDKNLLGDRTITLQEWIDNGDTPDISSYFVLEELCGEKGPWVLLDGYICQEDLEAKRTCFIFPRGLFIQKDHLKAISAFLRKQNLGGRWLPEIPEDYYVYAGEIPWCDTFSYNGQTDLGFVISTKKRKVILPYPAFSKEKIVFEEKEQEIEEPDEKRVFKVFIPVRDNNWESYHSSVNPGRSVMVPAKEIEEFLGLCTQPQTFDLYEQNGKRASITIRCGETWHTSHHLIFIRRDLLNRYLKENKLCLIWGVWGEREFRSKNNEDLEEFAKKHKTYKVFQEIKSYGEMEDC